MILESSLGAVSKPVINAHKTQLTEQENRQLCAYMQVLWKHHPEYSLQKIECLSRQRLRFISR